MSQVASGALNTTGEVQHADRELSISADYFSTSEPCGSSSRRKLPSTEAITTSTTSALDPVSISPNNKEKQAQSSHRGTKKSTCAAFAQANLLQKANPGSSWRLSSEQFGGTECSFVYHVPGPRGISPGYFLPQQGIVSILFSGAGRQPISAPPVLFLANEVWITWL